MKAMLNLIMLSFVFTLKVLAEEPLPPLTKTAEDINDDLLKAYEEIAGESKEREEVDEQQQKYEKNVRERINEVIAKPTDEETKKLFEQAMSAFREADDTLSPKPCHEDRGRYKSFDDIAQDYMAKSNYYGDDNTEEDRVPNMMYGPFQPSTMRQTSSPDVDPSQPWIGHLFKEVEKAGFSTITPTPQGTLDFCPNYESLDKSQRDNFWHSLMMGMAYKESNFKNNLTYRESFGPLSSGLFQISLESGRGYAKYGCQLASQQDLFDPMKNSTCAVAIFKRWLYQDDTIVDKSGESWRGPARYWSVLRYKKDEIKAFMKKDIGQMCGM